MISSSLFLVMGDIHCGWQLILLRAWMGDIHCGWQLRSHGDIHMVIFTAVDSWGHMVAKLLRRLRRGIAGGWVQPPSCRREVWGVLWEVWSRRHWAGTGGQDLPTRGAFWRGTFLSQADEGPLYFNRGRANWGLFYFLEVFSFLFVSSGCSARCSHA